jgi:lipoprotein signal peptidase
MACILGGAIGNVIDRMMHGYVVDFIDVHYAGWHFPAFNIADSAISIGAVCLIWTSCYGCVAAGLERSKRLCRPALAG